jgi:hypothetical protein
MHSSKNKQSSQQNKHMMLVDYFFGFNLCLFDWLMTSFESVFEKSFCCPNSKKSVPFPLSQKFENLLFLIHEKLYFNMRYQSNVQFSNKIQSHNYSSE